MKIYPPLPSPVLGADGRLSRPWTVFIQWLFELVAAVGTVTVTGTPSAGNLTVWSGASEITNGNLSGDVTTSGSAATTIANNAVSFAKIQNISTARLLGRATAGTGNVEQITLGSGLSFVAGALVAAVAAIPAGVIGITIDGGGSVLTTGVKGFIRIPAACTIVSATLLSTDAAATAGSIVIDVWKDTFANYPPTVADTITASAKPTLTAANKSIDTTLTGWTTAVAAGDVLGFKVDSATTVTRVTLELAVAF